MVENVVRRRWLGRLSFVLLGLFIIFTHMIPLDTVPPSLGGSSLAPIEQPRATAGTETDILYDPARWIAPDLLILMALAWVIRRPSFAPVLAIAGLFLLADMLFQRPPGLWAGLVLILTEILRGRARSLRTLPFWLEWASVGAGIAIITAIYSITLSMVLVPHGPLGLTILQMMLTVTLYPVVVLISYTVFGVKRPAPGEVDALGHKL